MPTTTEEKPKKKQKKRPGLAPWFNTSVLSSFGVAIIIHLLVALSIGSYVIFEGIDIPDLFDGTYVETSEPFVAQEEELIMEEEPLPMVESADVDVIEVAPMLDQSAPDFRDILTVPVESVAPTFRMPNAQGISKVMSNNRGKSQGNSTGVQKIKMSSLFGSRSSGGESLSGYLYDFKQTDRKKPTELSQAYNKGNTGKKQDAYNKVLSEFTRKWDSTTLAQYFRSDDPLSITQFIMPSMSAKMAPEAFNVERDVEQAGWLVNYTGTISPPYSGTFRFVGAADDILIVRIEEKVVFNGSFHAKYWHDNEEVRQKIGGKFAGGPGMLAGKWIKMSADKQYKMDVALGEVPGGKFWAFLLVQDEDEEYQQHSKGYPILPAFQMAPTEIPQYADSDGYKVLEDGLVFGAQPE
ncbi:MAG: hypothetical protein AAFY98_01440 [Verrucomicrobiota bacterium]